MRREHPDELRADLQQYYSLDIDMMGIDHSVAHYAACAAMLPLGSRTMSAIDPAAAWGWQERLLSLVEYDLRVLAWQRSRDGANGRNRPKRPIEPPSRKAAPKRPSEAVMREVADALGVSLDEYGGGD